MRVVEKTGVRTGMLRRVDKPTCLIPVVFDEEGQPSYHIPEDVSWDWIDVTGSDIEAVRGETFDCFVFGTIEQRSETSRCGLHRLLEEGRFRCVVLDVNLRAPFYSPDVVAYSLHHCTTAKMSAEEAAEINGMLEIGPTETEPFCAAIRERFGIERVIVTAGAAGASRLLIHDRGKSDRFSRCSTLCVQRPSPGRMAVSRFRIPTALLLIRPVAARRTGDLGERRVNQTGTHGYSSVSA